MHSQGKQKYLNASRNRKILSDQCTLNSLLDVSQTGTIVEEFHNLDYATQNDSSMLAACGHSFNSAPSSDHNFSAGFSTFVNELLDAKTPEIRENFTSLEDSFLSLRKQRNMDGSKRLQIEPDYVFSDALSYYKRADFDPKIPSIDGVPRNDIKDCLMKVLISFSWY